MEKGVSRKPAERERLPAAAADLEAIRTEARRRLEECIDPAYGETIRGLVPSGSRIMGVRVPVIRDLAKALLAEYRELNAPAVCDLMDACCRERCREELLLVLVMLARFRRRLTPEVWPRIDRWIEAIDNWEVCDHLARNIAAELVARDPRFERDLLAWTGSRNHWRRRFALAVTTALNQGGRRNVELALRICEPLMRDSHDMVQKAVGWALRDAAKHDRAGVGRFLDRWASRADPKILREAGRRK